MHSRIAGRLFTGTVAFALAGVADWGVLAWRVLWARARRRSPWE